MLEAARDTHLCYKKHDVKSKATPNSEKIAGEYGDQEISVPRERIDEFEPLVIRKHQSNVIGIKVQIIDLYAKGVGTREIQDHLQNLYGLEISPTFISN